MGKSNDRVRYSADTPSEFTVAETVLHEAERRGLGHIARVNLPCGFERADELIALLGARPRFTEVQLDRQGKPVNVHAIVARDDHLISANATPMRVHIEAWAKSQKRAAKVAADLAARVPAPKQPEDPRVVEARFWMLGGNGPTSFIKRIDCQPWDEVESNYLARCRRGFEKISATRRPDIKGKLVFWHGPPGTGKTWAIRALMLAWKGRVSAEVVTDPQAFFANPEYMHHVVLGEEGFGRVAGMPYYDDGSEENADPDESFRLFIMEDSAELVMEGCRLEHGFGRFLNLTDGLIGQGLRCLFLLTANETIGQIDPALLRPGRCIQVLEFGELTRADARAWLDRHGHPDLAVPHAPTLANLYAAIDGEQTPAPRAPEPTGLGFGR